MVDRVEICNMSAGQVKAGTISTFEELSVLAQYCRTYYVIARQEALAAYNWSFARRRYDLALLEENPTSQWLFRYGYPECIKVREIEYYGAVKPATPIPFEVELDSTGQVKTILTNEKDAKAICTVDVENEALFSFEFVVMFMWKLASYLAIPMGAGADEMKRCLTIFNSKKGESEASDANEGQDVTEPDGEFITSRG